ncbi:MAG TPA: 23S rRNA (adenine(2503)-C(2))-methyltransferase RlmN, partial [Acidobacteriota bacterium]
MKPPLQKSLLGRDLQELTAIVEKIGEPSFRGHQLFDAIYRQRLELVEEVSTLSRELRRSLDRQGYSVGLPAIQRKFTASDGTIRYLIAFVDRQTV